MRLLVVGGGGREHALCWALARTATVFCAPGNAGTAGVATNVPADPSDHQAILQAVRNHAVDLAVIGPEAPLAAGIVDALEAAGIRAFGPAAAPAQLESSKAFAKEVLAAAQVPTARTGIFTELSPALDYIASHPEPLVVKASGLAAGKGAVVCQTRDQATETATLMFGGRYGEAGQTVLVEQFLEGEELSIFVITDGEQVMMLPACQDHKRLGEGDTGPNTGGMGAYAPVSIATDLLLRQIENQIARPVLNRLSELGAPYRGVLYLGLMILSDDTPMVLEFNCRLGDPEAQVVLPAIDIDIGEHMWAIASREPWRPENRIPAVRAAVTTVLASAGYPESPDTGAIIRIPHPLAEDTLLFHAGARLDAEGLLRTAGGRVLSATGLGPDVGQAAERSRALAEAIEFEGKVYRRDIAWREVARAGTP